MFVELELSEKEFDILERFYANCMYGLGHMDIAAVGPIIGRVVNSYQHFSKDERNAAVYEMRKKGSSYKDISEKYKISVERARQIYLNEERKKQYRKQLQESKTPSDMFYKALAIVVNKEKRDARLASRIYNILARNQIIKQVIEENADFDNYSDRELLSIPGVGIVQLNICRKAYELYKDMIEQKEVLDGC